MTSSTAFSRLNLDGVILNYLREIWEISRISEKMNKNRFEVFRHLSNNSLTVESYVFLIAFWMYANWELMGVYSSCDTFAIKISLY